MILLTEDEIGVLLGVNNETEYSGHIEERNDVARAQLKKVVEWLVDNSTSPQGDGLWDGKPSVLIELKLLEEDWQNLKKEVGI